MPSGVLSGHREPRAAFQVAIRIETSRWWLVPAAGAHEDDDQVADVSEEFSSQTVMASPTQRQGVYANAVEKDGRRVWLSVGRTGKQTFAVRHNEYYDGKWFCCDSAAGSRVLITHYTAAVETLAELLKDESPHIRHKAAESILRHSTAAGELDIVQRMDELEQALQNA
jgi:hypothetical protein